MFTKENGVEYLTQSKLEFEELYVEVRTKENRILTDQEVKQLPFVPSNYKHYNEWCKRQFTLNNFTKYLQKSKPNEVLEIGCGNGWFSNQLSKHCNHVTGLDIGKLELEQAARCFQEDKFTFLCCSDLTLLPSKKYDLIVFNASLQYFQLTADFWANIIRCLTENGEIHIIDSPFYHPEQIQQAKTNSKSYFNSLNVEKASEYYFHLDWNKLPKNAQILYKPNRFLNKLIKNRSPFPWIKI